MDAFHPLAHPQIEYRALKALEREYSPRTNLSPGATTSVDILEVYADTIAWKKELNATQLPDLFPLDECKDIKPPKVRVFFLADANFLLERATGDNFKFAQANRTAQWMRQRFGVTPLFFRAVGMPWATPFHEILPFVHRSEGRKATVLDGIYHAEDLNRGLRYHTVWYSHVLGGDRSSTYFTCNFPEEAKTALVACAQKSDPTLLLRPISIDLFFAEAIVWKIQRDLWKMLEAVVSLENDPEFKSSMTPEKAAAAVAKLHDSSRRLHILHAHLCDARRVVSFLCTIVQKQSNLSSPGSAKETDTDGEVSILESLQYLQDQIEHLLDWQAVDRQRIATQIALFFNLSNQLDSRTNLDIARLTSKISVSTQRDSSSMITIAIVTMFFLPGTFVSAFFSMVFLDTTHDAHGRPQVVVGPQVWIYAVATIILTILVFCAWGLWHYRRIERQSRELDLENHAGEIPENEGPNGAAYRTRAVTGIRRLGHRLKELGGRLYLRDDQV